MFLYFLNSVLYDILVFFLGFLFGIFLLLIYFFLNVFHVFFLLFLLRVFYFFDTKILHIRYDTTYNSLPPSFSDFSAEKTLLLSWSDDTSHKDTFSSSFL